MATLVLTDAKILMGAYNLSGYHSSIEVGYEAEMLDNTVFGTSGTRSSMAGLKTFTISGNMFWESAVDDALFQRIGNPVADVMSVAPVGNAEGDRSYCVKAVQASYSPVSGEVGAIIRTSLEGRAAGTPLVRGQVMATGNKAVSGTGSGGLITAVSAAQRMYSALHITAIAGTVTPTFTGIIQSDDAGGFGTPVTRLSHPAATTIGANWQEAAGPQTDTYWRASWTISGTNPVFTVFWTFGIL